jgi:hypothetical protein
VFFVWWNVIIKILGFLQQERASCIVILTLISVRFDKVGGRSSNGVFSSRIFNDFLDYFVYDFARAIRYTGWLVLLRNEIWWASRNLWFWIEFINEAPKPCLRISQGLIVHLTRSSWSIPYFFETKVHFPDLLRTISQTLSPIICLSGNLHLTWSRITISGWTHHRLPCSRFFNSILQFILCQLLIKSERLQLLLAHPAELLKFLQIYFMRLLEVHEHSLGTPLWLLLLARN